MTGSEVEQLLRPLTIKDLRVQCRTRNISPAGSIDTLRLRLQENMVETKDFALKTESGEDMATVNVSAGVSSADVKSGANKNNYSRPAGQNVGNFMSDRHVCLLALGGGALALVRN